ncbi:MAG TPA: M48 family metallopeptidase [Micromonosporaceae bacterium]|nr:M48 family metallopeptidase [Micromonosporaceae bacterium]
MLTTIRAAVAVALLVGFYLFAVGLVVGLVWAGVVVADSWSERAGAKLIVLALIAGVGLIVALWKVVRARPSVPAGVQVDPVRAPELRSIVARLAREVGTRVPDEVQLVAEVNAAVWEDTRWMGLVGGRRYLLIGTPLLQTFTVDQLRSVLAHELGHYSHSHTRLSALTYRGRLSIVHTVSRLPDILAAVMAGYGRLYMLVESAVSRRQEYEADLASVRLAGKEAAASALSELPVLARAWDLYLRDYVAWGLDSGYAPADVVTSFPQMWRARAGEIDQLRRNPAPEKRSRWDSHPPMADRIAAILAQPDAGVPGDRRPASVLVPDLAQLAPAVDQHEFNFGSRPRVSFVEYTARAAQANHQVLADRLYRAAGRLAGDPQPGLHTVHALIGQGRHTELVRAVEAAGGYADLVRAALTAAAVRGGVAYWQLSWSDPVTLVDRNNAPFPVERYAAPLIAGDPAGTQQSLAALAALGLDFGAARAVEPTVGAASAARSEVVGAMTNIKVNGPNKHLLILDTGLLVVPGPAWYKRGSGTQRHLVALANTPPGQLLATAGHEYLPYEEMARVVYHKGFGWRYDITMQRGAVIRISDTMSTDDLGKTKALARLLGPLAARQQAR